MVKKRFVTSEIKKSLNQAVDQLPQPSFEKIANQPIVKMERMDAITSQDIPKSGWLQKFFSPVQVRRMAAVCGCLLFFLAAGAGGIYSYENVLVDSVVDIDVNPGFELKINRKDKVLTFSPLNKDAVQASEGLEYKGWNVEDAVRDLCRIMEEKAYLTDEKRTVLISVENKNPDRVTQLQNRLSDCFRTSETAEKSPVRVVTQERKKDKGASRTAQNYHISAGKLQFVRTMTANYPDLDEKTLSQMTMEQLYGIILERESEKPEWLQMDEEDWQEYREDLEDDESEEDDDDLKEDDDDSDGPDDENEDDREPDDEESEDNDDGDRDSDDRRKGPGTGEDDNETSDEKDSDDDREDRENHDSDDDRDDAEDQDTDDDRGDTENQDTDDDRDDRENRDTDDDQDDRENRDTDDERDDTGNRDTDDERDDTENHDSDDDDRSLRGTGVYNGKDRGDQESGSDSGSFKGPGVDDDGEIEKEDSNDGSENQEDGREHNGDEEDDSPEEDSGSDTDDDDRDDGDDD